MVGRYLAFQAVAETRNVTALAAICDAMQERVKPDRLNLAQCANLACSRVTPVAKLGLAWLQGRPIQSEDQRAAITGLAAAECEEPWAKEIAKFALAHVGNSEKLSLRPCVAVFRQSEFQNSFLAQWRG